MDWYVHSRDEQTRRMLRAGPFASEARALEFASRQWKVRLKPMSIEGPKGQKIEGQALAERIERLHQNEH
jgi:hypothetical protein